MDSSTGLDHHDHRFNYFEAKLTNEEFNKLSSFITQEFGIKMPSVKKVMLQSRLQKRLRDLGMDNFKEYIAFLFSKKGMSEELVHMIDVVTTNKTDFFRESNHFDYLSLHLLPDFVRKNSSMRPLKIWSAGCSSGEEPYTMCIVLSEFAEQCPGFDYSVLATDISTRVLEKAVTAIYPEDRIDVVPMMLKRKYFLRSKDHNLHTVRVVPELRKRVSFTRLNFMDSSYSIPDLFDVIFCRNVLIYFDREDQERIINKLCTKLRTGGYFFLGHSESIMNIDVPLQQIRPTIFVKI